MLTVEVAGKTVDRFRAYAMVKMTRKPNASDHRNRALAGKSAFNAGDRIRYDVSDVALSGAVRGASLKFDASDTTIAKVVLYRGPADAEVVVGSVDVNASGEIAIEMVEPPESVAGEGEIIDE